MFEDFSTFVDQFELILESQDPAFKRIENYRRLFQVKPATEEAKLIDEAVESALIRVVKKNWVKFRDDFDSLIKLYNFAPRLAVRTSDSIRRQAFSTPIPISALASKLLDCTPESTVYEPTAGMGALLLDANPKYTQVNEIDHLRAWVLAQQEFDQVTSFDATTWYPDQSFDRVISTSSAEIPEIKFLTKGFSLLSRLSRLFLNAEMSSMEPPSSNNCFFTSKFSLFGSDLNPEKASSMKLANLPITMFLSFPESN